MRGIQYQMKPSKRSQCKFFERELPPNYQNYPVSHFRRESKYYSSPPSPPPLPSAYTLVFACFYFTCSFRIYAMSRIIVSFCVMACYGLFNFLWFMGLFSLFSSFSYSPLISFFFTRYITYCSQHMRIKSSLPYNAVPCALDRCTVTRFHFQRNNTSSMTLLSPHLRCIL